MIIGNFYCGIGGNRMLWGDQHTVFAVDNNRGICDAYQKIFPADSVMCGDAIEVLMETYELYDFIWSSPPCVSHSRISRKRFFEKSLIDSSLHQLIIFLRTYFKGKWVVENVTPFYGVVTYNDVMCTVIGRHVYYSNFDLRMARMAGQEDRSSLEKIGIYDLIKFLGMPDVGKIPGVSRETVYRNCVYPPIGRAILRCALGEMVEQKNENQLRLF